MDKFEAQKQRIDDLFKTPPERDPHLVTDHLLACATRGMESPESLSLHEIRQVCYALVVDYAHMGIG